MKKFSIVLLSLFSFLIAFSQTKNAFAASDADVIKDIGYSYNVIKHPYLEPEYIKIEMPIFDETWLQSLSFGRTNMNYAYQSSYSGLTFNELTLDISLGLKFSNEVKGKYAIFSGSAKTGFSVDANFKYSQYKDQYYNVQTVDVKRYTKSLPGLSDLTEYKNHLHQYYLNDLAKLNNGTMTYEAFFEKYGTHVIAKGLFGGRLEIYSSVVTNNQTIDASIEGNLDIAYAAGVDGLMKGTSSKSINVGAKLGLSSGQYTEKFYAITKGGIPFVMTSWNISSSNYAAWAASFADVNQAVLVGVSDENGLIPLWDLLPSQYSSLRNTMVNAFNVYNAKNNEGFCLDYNVNHKYVYTDYNTTQHKAICKYHEEHGVYWLNHNYIDDPVKGKCEDCNYAHNHQWGSAKPFKPTADLCYHKVKCTLCPYAKDELHVWSYDKGTYYCFCGQSSKFIPLPPDLY